VCSTEFNRKSVSHGDHEIQSTKFFVFSVSFVVENEIVVFMSTSEQSDEEISLTDLEENTGFNGAELSESVLAHDWNSPEEDAAWSNL